MKEQSEQRRQENLPRRRGRKGERGEGAAVTRRDCEEDDLDDKHGEPETHRAKDREPSFVRDRKRERDEDDGFPANDKRWIDVREARDNREDAMPERKRVPGMKSTVTELDDASQRERSEGHQLADAREMKQRIPTQGRGHRPERDTQRDPGESREAGHRRSWLELPFAPSCTRGTGNGDRGSERCDADRAPQRSVYHERRGESRPDKGKRPSKATGRDRQLKRRRDERPGCEQKGGRRSEPDPKPDPRRRKEPTDEIRGPDRDAERYESPTPSQGL